MQVQDNLILEDYLRDQGLHITTQRRVILDVLRRDGGSLTADEVFAEARKQMSQINLATIYRTLATLRQAGAVEQYYVSPDHHESHFKLADLPSSVTAPVRKADGERFHFHCLGCGKISEFVSADVVTIVTQALDSQVKGARVSQVCMCVEGYCPDCVSHPAQRREQA